MPLLLTETADYDTPGSWGKASEGWPTIRGDKAYDMYVFANCVVSAPYGSYVLVGQRDHYGDTESSLRVHADFVEQLRADFKQAGCPSAEQSIARREEYGRLGEFGLRARAPLWTAT